MSNDKVFKDIKSRLKVAQRVAKRKAIEELMVLIPELIKSRTRLGAGVNGNLKGLKKSTVDYRNRYSDNLSSETSPGESNLTATGQLLEAIKGRKSESGLLFEINKKKRKAELSGYRSGLTNDQVRKYVEENGREFFGLSDKEKKEVLEIAFELIKEEITRLVNK